MVASNQAAPMAKMRSCDMERTSMALESLSMISLPPPKGNLVKQLV
jgi:hypothetical protein